MSTNLANSRGLRPTVQFSLRLLLVLWILLSVGLAIGSRWISYWRLECSVAADIESCDGNVSYCSVFGRDMDPDGSMAKRIPFGGAQGWSFIEEIHFLAGPTLGDFRFDRLKELQGLAHFTCVGTDFTDAHLHHILQCRDLRSLDLTETGVTSAGIARIASCHTLTSLKVSGVSLSRDEILQLENLRGLRYLDVTLDSKGLGTLLDSQCFRNLWALAIHVSDDLPLAEVKSELVASWPQLESLHITGVKHDEHLSQILLTAPSVRLLTMSRCEVSARSRAVLSRMGNLSALSIITCRLNDDDIAFVGELQHLDSLSLRGNAIGAASVLQFVPRTIHRLDLEGTNVTDEIVEYLRANPILEKVNLRRSKVSPLAVQRLRAEFPQLSISY